MSSIKTITLLIGVALLLPGQLFAQEQLSLEQAIRIGLEKNYDIQIVSKEQAIYENNVALGNAGFLPVVDARASRTNSVNNSRQEFQTTEPREVTGANSNNLNASVNLNWVIFDGFGMFINYDRLKALEKTGKLLTKEAVQNTVANIIDAYFEVVRQGQKILSIEDAIAISEERVEITQAQYEVGMSAKVEILRAQVDYNADRSELLQQLELLRNSKINLNQLLGRDPDVDFVPTDSIRIDPSLNFGNIDAGALSANPLIQRLQVNREIAHLDFRSVRAARFPTVTFTNAYNFSRSASEALSPFQAINSRNRGYNYGLSVNFNIFNGFNLNRQAQNARIAIETSTLALQREQNRLQSDVARAFNLYTNRQQLLELEESNLTLAQQNAEIALERYRLGLLTAIELREAQRNQLVAENRLTDIRYEAKAAETELKRLRGNLVLENQ